MKKIVLFLTLLLCFPLCACTAGTLPEASAQPTDMTVPETASGTDAPQPDIPPWKAAAPLDDYIFPEAVSPVCKQAVLRQTDIAAAEDAFLKSGYSPVRASDAYGTSLQTSVLQNEGYYVTLMQMDNGNLRILWEKRIDVSIAPLTQDKDAAQGDVTLVQVGIARENEPDNPMIGMCYVYRLADGTAVIIDGGMNNDSCAHNLYRTLETLKIAKDESGQFRITAWIFSHAHPDHIGTFIRFASLYGDKTDLAYSMYSFPVGSADNAFEGTMHSVYPDACLVSPHAGLQYHFGNLTVHMLCTPEFISTNYLNNTSLIFRAEANGHSVLHMGDAGELASEKALKENTAEAFRSDVLQITHHGLYTGPESHSWTSLLKIYEAADASVGLLPMGTRRPGDARNGRHTVLVGWGSAGYQISFAVNESDDHGIGSVSQEYYNAFTDAVAAGTAEQATLFGYDGINTVKNENGMVTYLSAGENELMATVLTLAEAGLTVTSNTELAEWLEP